jgi:hypothetical protein
MLAKMTDWYSNASISPTANDLWKIHAKSEVRLLDAVFSHVFPPITPALCCVANHA